MILDSGQYVGNHRGKFKFWPDVYELWWYRSFQSWPGHDFDGKVWKISPEDFEVDYYCSRRQ